MIFSVKGQQQPPQTAKFVGINFSRSLLSLHIFFNDGPRESLNTRFEKPKPDRSDFPKAT